MIEDFGTTPDGEPVKRITIGDDVLSVSMLTYGATMQSLRLSGVPHSLCLGFDTLEGYLDGGAYVGAIVGRVANRIGGGQAIIDGTPCDFDRNDREKHTLHGGFPGIARKNWVFSHDSPRVLRLNTRDFHGENGFPGNLEISATFTVLPGGVLEISLEAETDAPTLCNLAPHPYFNLNGSGDAREQSLSVAAAAITETDDDLIPTGKLVPVVGTAWDHRHEKRMLDSGLAYDTNFCLADGRLGLRPVARLSGQGVTMGIATTEPGLQVYDGAGLGAPYSGIALEPQSWPDAPNHAGFPDISLWPGQVSRQVSRFNFSTF